MTESIIGIMQSVAAKEVEKIYTTELGVVTAIFPHASEGDKDNYQVSVKLKNRKEPDGSAFELRKVPVAIAHIGMANIPNINDLVLISFIGGNINAPVIIGRLYNDEDRPPVNKEKEVLLQHTPDKGSSLKIDSDGVLTLSSQEEKTSLILEDGAITITTSKDQVKVTIEDGGITLDTGSKPVTIKSSGEIKIGDASSSKVSVGGRALASPIGDGDDILLMPLYLGNFGFPCAPINPTYKMNSIQAKARNTQVG